MSATDEKQVRPRRRRGGYRPVLVDEAALKHEARALAEPMSAMLRSHAESALSDQDLVATYLLVYLNERYPNQLFESVQPIVPISHPHRALASASSASNASFLTRTLRNENVRRRIVHRSSSSAGPLLTLFDLINTFALHSVPHTARVALVNWYVHGIAPSETECTYDLVLFVNRVPSALDVLRMQARSQRCVTLVGDAQRIGSLVMNERDPLSFLLHDLVHANKMFADEHLRRSQVGFCTAMLRLRTEPAAAAAAAWTPWLDELLVGDEQFAADFDYLIADMNAHARHLLQYFKANLINAYKRKHGVKEDALLEGQALAEYERAFSSVLERFGMNDEAEVSVAHRLLSTSEGDVDFTPLDTFFLQMCPSSTFNTNN